MTNKSLHPERNIRRSQLLTPFGVGSLFDINNQTVMIADSEYWNKNEFKEIHDPRLEQAMNTSGFIEPPISVDDSTGVGISGIRFPQWYLSPYTRQIQPIYEWRKMADKNGKAGLFDERPFDASSKSRDELVPLRFICVCSNGHIQDFPWVEWPHNGKICKHPDLELNNTHNSGSILDYSVHCKNCGKRKSLGIIFNKNAFSDYLNLIGVHCKGNYVWKNRVKSDSCNQGLQVLLRSANNLYFPNISSSVNIPFDDHTLIKAIKADEVLNPEYLVIRQRIKKIANGTFSETIKDKLGKDFIVQSFLQNIVDVLRNSYPNIDQLQVLNEIIDQVDSEKSASDDEDIDVMDYRREEFNILSGITPYDNSSDKLIKQTFNQKDLLKTKLPASVKCITLIHELQVVSVLRSYSRLKPTDSDSMKEIIREEGENTEFSKEVSLRRTDGRYVGMRSHGEGIFITLDPVQVATWMDRIKGSEISERILNKVNNPDVFEDEKKYITPDYYLLHTLSHIILKELSISSGYSATALKERLYFSNEVGQEMYGILIYTSSSDSEGTLGGLVKQGVPEKMKWILLAAIEKAKWCSFDPVCIDSEGQGNNSLNAGACHACALVSETSCEKRNQYLDRGVLIGELDTPELGFFSKFIK
ncbi:DUF1998 domain-containing protein [Lactiplantibacillus plantarum]|uniref:DUF1998 domain-containing protein n=1 Tax=Lactiplantibacillus plantarum TaxID=1590 RepID=UPI0007B554C6|nr:DUF1998 domain-containing protein [Lactiplantibacillus plantarum]KZU67242.1 hypothetical protein Nizo2814_1074 [Lactiplantibacillus plantarum]